MIELTFNDAFGGVLNHCRSSLTEALSFAIGDVFCCDENLSWGEIAGDLWATRRRWVSLKERPWLEAAEQKLWLRHDIQRLRQVQESVGLFWQRFEEGEMVRLWVSPLAPSEVCGACWVLSLLSGRAEDVVVCYPSARAAWDETPPCCWAQCPEGSIGSQAVTRAVSMEERRQAVARWTALCEENAPLRAIVNGLLVSVPADFYDDFLREVLAPVNEPAPVAHIVGSALLRPGLAHLGDDFILSRLWALRQAGEIELFRETGGRGRIFLRRCG